MRSILGKIIVCSLDEMLAAKRLKYGDEVNFKDSRYVVRNDHLEAIIRGRDIFHKHGLNKYDFCKLAYGYNSFTTTKRGSWPPCRYGDFIALSNCVTMLYVLDNNGKFNERFLDGYIAHSMQESEARILNLMELIDHVKTAKELGVK